VDVVWLPFELHPEVPPQGMRREELLSPERMQRVEQQLRMMSAETGLVMRPRERLINSRSALAAAELAREKGAFNGMHRALFKAHWEGTSELDRVDDLVAIGAGYGLDALELRQAIEEGRYDALIDANRREAVEVGIDGIPAHIFGRRYLVMGAQPLEVFQQVLERLREPPGGDQ
jgi:predicted DsbA family dithiol-disulfide isomerase